MNRSQAKPMLLIALLIVSVIGFMVRLPNIFHQMDKELHAIFYAGSFFLLCMLYPNRWFGILVLLGLFGLAIEHAQEYSNKISLRLIGKRIHGRFDPEDIRYNIIGLGIGLALFSAYSMLFRKFKKETT
jgi:hypothetical protein